MKNKDQSEFAESFGKVFQAYIQKGLEYLDADFRDDRSLVSTYGEKKQVDFVLIESDCIILIESKAIEMSPLASVNPTNVILENYFQDSILKALRQIYSTVRSVVAEPEKIGTKHIKQIFALVVTFKELYLFNGNSVWEEFAKDKIASFLKDELIDSKLLPPCNIFFITIEEYDLLLTILKTGDEPLSKILNKAIQDDFSPNTAKYVFKSHLENYSVRWPVLPYVGEAADKMFNNVIKKAQKNERG